MNYTLLSETFPIARKKHRCIWCGESIEPGTKYRHEKSIYDEFQDHKWHLECIDAFWGDADDFEIIAYENERPAALAAKEAEK